MKLGIGYFAVGYSACLLVFRISFLTSKPAIGPLEREIIIGKHWRVCRIGTEMVSSSATDIRFCAFRGWYLALRSFQNAFRMPRTE